MIIKRVLSSISKFLENILKNVLFETDNEESSNNEESAIETEDKSIELKYSNTDSDSDEVFECLKKSRQNQRDKQKSWKVTNFIDDSDPDLDDLESSEEEFKSDEEILDYTSKLSYQPTSKEKRVS